MQDATQELCEVLDLIPWAHDSTIKGVLFDVGDVIINQYDEIAAEMVFGLYGIERSLTMDFLAARGNDQINPLYVFEHERTCDVVKAEEQARKGMENWLREQTGNCGLKLTDAQFRQIYTSIFKAENPDMISLMRALGQLKYYVGVLTNTNSIHFGFIVKSVPGLRHVVDPKYIYASHLTGRPKPSPESYLQPVRDFGIKPKQCLFVDNNSTNVRGAKKAGLMAVLCNPNRLPDAIREIVVLIAGKPI